MQKNSITYLLIILVMVVWGIVFYNIFNHSDKNKNEQVCLNIQPHKKENMREKLLLNYKNPFRIIKKVKPKIKPIEVKKEPPTFKYKGFIQGAKNKVLIIENNGVQEIVNSRHNLLGFKIISINKDSIVVRKNKINYSLIKN
ncbi:MAG: hypothetical protein IMY73_04565 [Bacteroidetes bacterium]|nr:hypothetical protein [Bacteroidota bacterium]